MEKWLLTPGLTGLHTRAIRPEILPSTAVLETLANSSSPPNSFHPPPQNLFFLPGSSSSSSPSSSFFSSVHFSPVFVGHFLAGQLPRAHKQCHATGWGPQPISFEQVILKRFTSRSLLIVLLVTTLRKFYTFKYHILPYVLCHFLDLAIYKFQIISRLLFCRHKQRKRQLDRVVSSSLLYWEKYTYLQWYMWAAHVLEIEISSNNRLHIVHSTHYNSLLLPTKPSYKTSCCNNTTCNGTIERNCT